MIGLLGDYNKIVSIYQSTPILVVEEIPLKKAFFYPKRS